MVDKPKGKPPTASDDARASDGNEADKRRDEAVKAADERVEVQKETAK
ncbi:hypothetical protein G8E10_04840 [Rhizobiaceae bacterium CRRU44]|uniref:Uncharacterized protein n=1 Tax=Ferranicluibacter rubi TaxID=2715133 RepID=A0AA43ZDN1_9HYPH|nr:hypothetical protein [Ferranicluibacter rubi]NHT75083.1 hypothetical protein [Ferranicluibacter rubi]